MDVLLPDKQFGTFRGITVDDDGVPVGIAGVMHTSELQAFSTLRFDPTKHKRLMVRAVREYRKLLSSYTIPVYAAPNPALGTADGFLKHVGFEEREDGLYQWTPYR